jgi:hypothetical protein
MMQKVSNKKANVCPKKKKVIIHMYIRVGLFYETFESMDVLRKA